MSCHSLARTRDTRSVSTHRFLLGWEPGIVENLLVAVPLGVWFIVFGTRRRAWCLGRTSHVKRKEEERCWRITGLISGFPAPLSPVQTLFPLISCIHLFIFAFSIMAQSTEYGFCLVNGSMARQLTYVLGFPASGHVFSTWTAC